MYRIIILVLISPLVSFSYGQKTINLLTTDFTFNGKDFVHKDQLRATFEKVASNPKYPFRFADRENLDLVITTIKKEENIAFDFKQEAREKMVIAKVDYVIKGELKNVYADINYYLNLLFITINKDESTLRLQMVVKIPHKKLLDYEYISILLEKELDGFVKVHFLDYATSPDILNAQSITERLFSQDSVLKEQNAEIEHLKNKIEVVKNDINVINAIASASKRMANGEYEGLEILRDISINNTNPENREKAKNELNLNCKRIEYKVNRQSGINHIQFAKMVPDSIKQKLLTSYKLSTNKYMNLKRMNLESCQFIINEVGRIDGKLFSICSIEEFIEWANSKGIKASLD